MNDIREQERQKWKAVISRISQLADDRSRGLDEILDESQNLVNSYVDWASPSFDFDESGIRDALSCSSWIQGHLEEQNLQTPRCDLITHLAERTEPGEIIYLCGAAGTGKTALMSGVAAQFLHQDAEVQKPRRLAWVNLQHNPMNLIFRLLSIRTRQSLSMLEHGKITREAYSWLALILSEMCDKKNLYYTHALFLTPYELATAVRRMAKNSKLDYVIIDGYPVLELEPTEQKKLYRCLRMLGLSVNCPILFTLTLPEPLAQNFSISGMAMTFNMNIHDASALFHLFKATDGSFTLSAVYHAFGVQNATKLDFDPETVSFKTSLVVP